MIVRMTASAMACGAVLAVPAHADTRPTERVPVRDWAVLGEFSLAPKLLGPAPVLRADRGARQNEPAPLDGAMFVLREPLGPSWKYQSGRDGPVLAFESLGASRKGRPRLVHVALDWEF